VLAHDGAVEAASKRGVGTQVRFILPAKPGDNNGAS
jgi:hypothetical protein